MNRQVLTIGIPSGMNEKLKEMFAREQLRLIACSDFQEAKRRIGREVFQLIIMSVYLWALQEATDAILILRHLTKSPLIVLTPDENSVALFQCGADACHPSTTSRDKIFANGMALIRNRNYHNQYDPISSDTQILYRGDLTIDPLQHRVMQAEREIRLQPKEFDLLYYLARNPNIVLSAERICVIVWKSEYNYKHNVAVAIAELRRKLNDDKRKPKYIETVHGVGYRFCLCV